MCAMVVRSLCMQMILSFLLKVAAQLTKIMINVSNRLNNCHLQLNTSKTDTVFFAKTKNSYTEPDVFISGQRIQIVNGFKYLGIILDGNMTFKQHVKKVSKIINFTLRNHVDRGCKNVRYMFSHNITH